MKKIANYIVYKQQEEVANIIVENFKNGKRAQFLKAEMQQGKSGALLYIAWLMHCQAVKHIFHLTNICDNSLKDQVTKVYEMAEMQRIVTSLHGANIEKKLFGKSEKIDWNKTLLIIDEAHWGIKQQQRLDLLLTKIGVNLAKPPSEWENQGFSLLMITATGFAQDIHSKEKPRYLTAVSMGRPDNYFGVLEINNKNRIKDKFKLLDSNKELLSRQFIAALEDAFSGSQAGYFIIRKTGVGAITVLEQLVEKGYNVECYTEEDPKIEGVKHRKIKELDSFLACKPENNSNTVVLIKGTLRAGKELKTVKYIKGACEPSSGIRAADTAAQGLLGRFCGYSKDRKEASFPIYICKDTVKSILNYFEGKSIPHGNNNRGSIISKKKNGTYILYSNQDTRRGSRASNNKETNLIEMVLNGSYWSYYKNKDERPILLDKPAEESNHRGSWKRLLKERPDLRNKWVIWKESNKSRKIMSAKLGDGTIFGEKFRRKRQSH